MHRVPRMKHSWNILKPISKYFDWVPRGHPWTVKSAHVFLAPLRWGGDVWGKKRGSGVKKKPAAIEKLKGHLRRTNYLEDLGRLNLKRAHVLQLAKTGLQTATRTVWNRIQNHAELWEHTGCYPGPPWQDDRLLLKYASSWAVLWFQSS